MAATTRAICPINFRRDGTAKSLLLPNSLLNPCKRNSHYIFAKHKDSQYYFGNKEGQENTDSITAGTSPGAIERRLIKLVNQVSDHPNRN